jgi:hypothetical protein
MLRLSTALVLVLVLVTGCGPRTETIELQMPRSTLRDVVRSAAVYPEGAPVFEDLKSNYRFAGTGFHVEGEYRADDGSLSEGFLDISIEVVDGELELTVRDHNVPGLDAYLPEIDEALAEGFARKVQAKFEEEVLGFERVQPVNDNVIVVVFELDRRPVS